MTNILILRNGSYALIDRGHEYVVACGYDETQPENQQWNHGIYFTPHHATELEKTRMLSKAIECFRIKVDEEYISHSRLEELATYSFHALIEDDEESAMEYFEYELDLTDFERKYFGIKTERE